MVRFLMVQGDVIVDDKKNSYFQMARSGLELGDDGNYLIATTESSKASFLVDGHPISLGPSSFIRISRDQTWLDKHRTPWTRDVKFFLGKIWSRIAGDPRDPDEGSGGGGGIRG